MLSGAGDRSAREVGDGRRRSPPGRRDGALIQLLDPPFDNSTPHPGYIKRLRPRRPRERRPVHPRRDLDGDGVRGDGRRAERAWELFGADQPGQPRSHARPASRSYRVEPYVVAADVYASGAAHRPRRLDLVHRLGRLDVPADHRVAARASSSTSTSSASRRACRRIGRSSRSTIATGKPSITSRCRRRRRRIANPRCGSTVICNPTT